MGVWLPPVERTKIIPVGTPASDGFCASCPAPETRTGGSMRAAVCTALSSVARIFGSRCVAGTRCTRSAVIRTSRAIITRAISPCSSLCTLSIASSRGARMSSEKMHSPGTTFFAPGRTSISPTVPTASGIAEAMRSSATMSSVAATSASLRAPITVAPAWSARPFTRTRAWKMPTMSLTTPRGMPARSRRGPCSMCSSRYARICLGSRAAFVGSPASPIARSASPIEMPFLSRRSAAPAGNLPNAADDPNRPMPKRAPSSSAHATSSTDRLKRTPASLSETSASAAQHTPSAPSKRPPSGTESMCDPTRTIGSRSCSPAKRA